MKIDWLSLTVSDLICIVAVDRRFGTLVFVDNVWTFNVSHLTLGHNIIKMQPNLFTNHDAHIKENKQSLSLFFTGTYPALLCI